MTVCDVTMMTYSSATFCRRSCVGEVGEVHTGRAKQGKTKLAEDDGGTRYKADLKKLQVMSSQITFKVEIKP